jgi:hypothetical protein
MPRMRRLIAVAFVAGTCSVGTAHAQSSTWTERGWFGISGGVQPTANTFQDAFDLTLYTEPEHITVDYPLKSGPVVTANGGYRVWKRLALGAGVSYHADSSSSTVKASLPHPFFDNTFRNIEGTARGHRTETGVHLQVGWMLPLSSKFRVLLTAGPSVISIDHTFVTNVTFAESFPFDTAEFTGAVTKHDSRTATGFNAGADLWWMFSKAVGAGALVQVTHARASLDAGDGRRVSVDAGGAQIGAGLRLAF